MALCRHGKVKAQTPRVARQEKKKDPVGRAGQRKHSAKAVTEREANQTPNAQNVEKFGTFRTDTRPAQNDTGE